jgi:hypothetical protein
MYVKKEMYVQSLDVHLPLFLNGNPQLDRVD